MSSYHFDPHDWRDKLPKGVKFYDFAGGVYQAPMFDPASGSYSTGSLVALVEDPPPPKGMKILGFQIPHSAMIRKNSDWGPLVDRMVDWWKASKVEPTKHGERFPVVDLYAEPEKTPYLGTPRKD